MRALTFDFDGVISDSARECFVVATRAFAELDGAARFGELASRLEDTPDLLAAVESEPAFATFVELMPLGNRAEDFGVALSAIARTVMICDQSDYDRFFASHSDNWRRTFHRRFYELRHALLNEDPERWLQLQRPYPAVVELIQRHHADVAMAIATAKDRLSLRLLLAEYGIAEFFREERVLDKETAVSKRVHLERILASLAVAAPDLTFIDDKVNHLDAVAPLGVRCALATWGYNGARERALATERGYLLCRQEDLERVLLS
jgi:phosphoglycolate phosphatase-like HAD superfamily hydrolase